MNKALIQIICCILFAQTACAECIISVRVTQYPIQYYQKQDRWVGMAIELLEALLSESSCKPNYKIQPWKRAQESIKKGKIDLMMNLSMTDERRKYLYFIGPQRDETMVLAISKEANYVINSLDDLKKVPGQIGIQRGAFYGKKFQTKYQSDKSFFSKFFEVTNAKQLIQMFNAGRLNGFFIDNYDLVHKIRTNEKYKNVKYHPFPIHRDWNYFGLSKKSISKDLLKHLQNAYDKAKAKKKFENVLKKYR